jgi:hypothetical protein
MKPSLTEHLFGAMPDHPFVTVGADRLNACVLVET